MLRASGIGAFLLATPAFRAIRRAHPTAEITLIGAARQRPLAERLPHLIDRFVVFPGFPGMRERDAQPRRVVEFLRWAQAERFDLAMQFHGSGVWSNPFVALLGARFALGFVRPDDEATVLGLDAGLPYAPEVHESERLLQLLAVVGIPDAGLATELPLRPGDRLEAVEVLESIGQGHAAGSGQPLLALHPGGCFSERAWPADRFALAARRLAGDLRARILVTGVREDRPATAAVAALAGGVDLAGRLSIPGLAALYERVSLVVSNDSGPAHLAYAVGAPSVTIFGTGSPAGSGPIDNRRHAVVDAPDACHPCGDVPCIQRVPVDAVVEAAQRVLAVNDVELSGARAAPG